MTRSERVLCHPAGRPLPRRGPDPYGPLPALDAGTARRHTSAVLPVVGSGRHRPPSRGARAAVTPCSV